VDELDQQRLMTKVARLYHSRGMRQTEIGERLHISQSRVSRLLQQAEEAGIVRTVVAIPRGLHSELEEGVERLYGVGEVHVVETVSEDEDELTRDLGYAMGSIVGELSLDAPRIGLTSWSRAMRQMVDSLHALRSGTRHVVEMVGDLGPPHLQHEAARTTQRLATLTGAEPVFLRTPGVVVSPELRTGLIEQDPYVRHALGMLDDLDLTFVGMGTCEVGPPLRPGENYFTREQLDDVKRRGAVGQVCLRFVDEDGGLVDSPLEDLVVGVSADQLLRARRRWAAAGGPSKVPTIRAALLGRWVDALVTDTATAAQLIAAAPAGRPSPPSGQG
jgi:DNA-binding transcriptional regulator LsrR (DeoR family)